MIQNPYEKAIVEAAVKWYKGETDHTGLADAIQDYLARQKHDEYFGSQKKEIAEIEPIWIATGLPLGATRADYLLAEKLNEVISVINRIRRNEK